MAAGLRLKCPVPLASEVLGPAAGLRDAGYIVVTTGLEEKYAYSRVFGKTSCDDGPGRAGPANNKVVMSFQVRTKLLLMGMDAFSEFGGSSRHAVFSW
jgi:hypothetical protein